MKTDEQFIKESIDWFIENYEDLNAEDMESYLKNLYEYVRVSAERDQLKEEMLKRIANI